MIARNILGSALLLAAPLVPLAHAEPPPIAVFARIPSMADVTISPDGRRIAFLRSAGGLPAAFVYDLEAKAPPQLLLASKPKVVKVEWCRFKSATRVLCGYRGTAANMDGYFPVSRLVAADVDGSHMKVLVQNTKLGESQYQDSVLDWLPGTPDKVLIELTEEHEVYRSVFELDVNDGSLHHRVRAREPILHFTTDASGEVRLGCGYRDTLIQCFTRDSKESGWRLLTKYEDFLENGGEVAHPLGFGPDRNVLYTIGTLEGREALWRVDLRDVQTPQLEFMHPLVDVGGAIRARDGRLLAVTYETDRPAVYYLDPDYEAEMRGIAAALPDRAVSVVSRSADDRRHVILAEADIDAGSYYLFDRGTRSLTQLGRAYPDLEPDRLGRMRSIEYPARDGTMIPGYLTVPRGVAATKLPLVVMPHGGPIARDSWEFNFLLQFLVSRGYAVLQMNFRGSSGYGDRWFYAAHQDWGGLTYTDIADATRWAVASGIADPARVAIVGWSFGGYAALLAAVRDGASYRGAVSIAGVSDLTELRNEERHFLNYKITERQLGTDSAKLKADSPARHASDAATPVLMVHGTEDWQVGVDQSKHMASALKWQKKPHELILLDGEGHHIDGEKARAQLLEAIERFLRQNLGPGVLTPPTSPPGSTG
jgi:dipeptidyl aminopeptidase/acylaminoacyl peptidase